MLVPNVRAKPIRLQHDLTFHGARITPGFIT
jgi:hypothetical protein